nr:hypothetical protein [Sediminibacillus terrae]
MPDKEKNVVLNFKMDGQVKYAETLREINSVMNTAAKEYKNHIAAMGNDATATDKLRAEKKKLEIQMEGAQKRTKMLRTQYEEMSKDTKNTTGQLTQMYGKLLDAEKAEASLQKSLDRVNGELTEQSQEVREAEQMLSGLKNEANLLEAEQKKLTSSFKLQKTELGANATEAQKVELSHKQLTSQIKLADRAVNNLERQLEATKKIYGENSVEVLQMETRLNEARADISKFNRSLQDLEDKGRKAGKSVGKHLKGGLQSIAGAAPAAAIGGLVTSMEDYNTALARLNTSASTAGLSMDDVNGAFNEMQLVSRDAETSVEGVNNLIAAGFDPTQIIEATQSISGAAIKWSDTLNVEGLSDAVQETIASGQSIGMFDELLSRSGANIDKFNEGLEKAKEKGQEQQYVLEQLTNLGLSSYLEKYKELNPEVVAQRQAQQELTDSLSELSIILTPLVTEVTEFTSTLVEWANEHPKLTAGIAATTAAIGALAVAVGALSLVISPIGLVIAGIAAAIAGIVLVIKNWGSITDWFSEKWNQFTAWLTEVVPKLAADFISWFLDMKNGAVDKFSQMKDSAIGKVTDLKDGGIKLLKGFKDGAIDKAKQMKDDFVNKTTELKDGAVDKFNELKKSGTDAVSSFKSNVSRKASDLKSAFVDKVTSLKDGALDKFNDLKNRAGQVMQTAKDKILSPIETARDKVSGIVDKITGFFSDMRLKIPKPSLPSLPHFSLEWGSRTIMGKTISYPSGIDVDWWAKGGIFTQPTIFGASGGRLQGAGEAGPEAVLPLNDKTLGSIGKGIARNMNQQDQKQPVIIQMVTPNKRVLAELVLDDIESGLNRKQNRKRRKPRG